MMKYKIFIFSILLLNLNLCSFSQVTQGLSYQSLIRDVNGDLVTETTIGIQISIIHNSIIGPLVYQETHAPLTNVNGLATIEVGSGTPLSGVFSEIDWSAGPYFIRSQVDPEGGTNYTLNLITELLAVPYAFHAETSGDNHWSENGTGINTTHDQVGVNSINPEHSLDVRSTSESSYAEISVSNSDKSRYLRLFSGSQTFPNPSVIWRPDHDLILATYNDSVFDFQEKMRISSFGDVGIGVDDPEARLDIRGGDWNLDAGNPGDLRIGNATNNFRIGVATGGGGAGITRMYANSNSLILGANDTPSLTLDPNGEIHATSLTNNIIENAGGKVLITKEYADATYETKQVETKEIMIPAASFTDLGWERYLVFNGIASADDDLPLVSSVILPVGAVITEVKAYIYDATDNTYECSLMVKNINTNSIGSFFTLSSDNGVIGHQSVSSTTSVQITSDFAYFLSFGPSDDSVWSGWDGLKGVKITYTEN